jgi:hypothetical protein
MGGRQSAADVPRSWRSVNKFTRSDWLVVTCTAMVLMRNRLLSLRIETRSRFCKVDYYVCFGVLFESTSQRTIFVFICSVLLPLSLSFCERHFETDSYTGHFSSGYANNHRKMPASD